jgi:hypothetical protein
LADSATQRLSAVEVISSEEVLRVELFQLEPPILRHRMWSYFLRGFPPSKAFLFTLRLWIYDVQITAGKESVDNQIDRMLYIPYSACQNATKHVQRFRLRQIEFVSRFGRCQDQSVDVIRNECGLKEKDLNH